MPTGIVVACQQERTQHKNRATAMADAEGAALRAGAEKREAAANAEAASRPRSAGATRSARYVLQPYQMVKDLRTGHETSNTGAVLDGDLDGFMEASLAARVTGTPTRSRNKP